MKRRAVTTLLLSVISLALALNEAAVVFRVLGSRLVVQDSEGYDPWVPITPQLAVDTTLPAGWYGAADATPADGDALQIALNNAVQNGDGIYIIELTAGVTYTSPSGAEGFIVRNKTGTGWLIIRTSGYASLPPYGTRVTPSDAANMATIRGTATEGALWFENAAHNVRIIGLEITTSYTSRAATVYSLVNCGFNPYAGTYPTTAANLPDHIIFDRVYAHGNATGNLRRAFYFDPKYGAIIESCIKECHEVGADSQAIGCLNSTGPHLIRNNRLEAAGENIIYGGGDPIIPNAVPSDITITRNHFYKPLTWKADDPSYGGIAWAVKNLFELKNAQRVLVEGNVLENCWVMGQAGYGVLFTVRNQDGTAEWSTVEDITFRKNWIKNTGAGFQITSSDSPIGGGGESQNTTRLLIENNLVEVDYAANGGDGRLVQWSANPSNPAEYISILHNTMIHKSAGPVFLNMGDSGLFTQQAKVNDNLASFGSYGVFANGGANGTAALTAYCGSYEFLNNALIVDGAFVGTYPATTLFPANVAACNFTNYAAGDYTITSGTLNNAGSDGTDVGADIGALDTAISGVVQ